MMGGGVCWLDYNGDGKLDLFAVNSYSSADTQTWEAHGGLPRSRAVRERRRPLPRRDEQDACGARGAGRRLRRRRPERRRAHRSRGHDDERCRRALERGRDISHDGAARQRLVHRDRVRRRERRRPARPVRRRLLGPERSGAGLARRLPDEHRGRPRPALPERRRRHVPRGRRRRRPRGERVPARTRRAIHGRERRRAARPVRGERRGSERALRQRALAGRREGRSRGARLPVRGARDAGGRRRSVRGHGHRRRQRATTRHELARRTVRGIPPERLGERSRTIARASTPGSAAALRAGVPRGSISRTPADSIWC